MTPIEPTTLLTVELQAQEWNMVMGACAELQRSVGTLMGKISQQAQSGQRRSNGSDTEAAFEAMRGTE
jgi:hypothetical protein